MVTSDVADAARLSSVVRDLVAYFEPLKSPKLKNQAARQRGDDKLTVMRP